MNLRSWQFAIFSLCIFFGSGLVKNTVVSAGGGQWCVAKEGVWDMLLRLGVDYACGLGGADCSPITPSGSCFTPDTLHDHASYAFNSYYQMHPIPSSCVFGGVATLTNIDPSSGNCHYSSSSTSISSPSSPDPENPTRSTATSTFVSLSMLFVCGFLVLLQTTNFI